jgi:hypothetical protein
MHLALQWETRIRDGRTRRGAPKLGGTVPATVRVEAPRRRGKALAMDLLYLGLSVGFFALSWAFIAACERLS